MRSSLRECCTGNVWQIPRLTGTLCFWATDQTPHERNPVGPTNSWRVLVMKQFPELDQRLAQMERIFRAPPLTPELIAAIKLISPQYDLAPSERDRLFWEADQNGACWGEYEALEPFLSRIPSDTNILEIGPGMGRSLVFFAKKLGWRGNQLHAYEGNGQMTKYTFLGPRFEDSFCGNITELRRVLDFNGIRDVTIFDAGTTSLQKLPGSYFLIYSFYSIGFHWSLEHFLDDLLAAA